MISILSLVILNDKGLRVQCSLSTSKNIVTSPLFWCIYIILILYMYLVKDKKKPIGRETYRRAKTYITLLSYVYSII